MTQPLHEIEIPDPSEELRANLGIPAAGERRMSAREKVISFLLNQGRRNRPVTNEAIAIGAKLKEKSVGPLVARLIREGLIVRVEGTSVTRGGGRQRRVMLEQFATQFNHTVIPFPPKPVPRRKLEEAADTLHRAACEVVESFVPTNHPSLALLRDALADYAELRHANDYRLAKPWELA